jgi:tetratricopeptide (TPR) repeat protein
MEALIFLVFFALYILVRVIFGGGKTDWEKQSQIHKEGINLIRSNQLDHAGTYFETALVQRPHDALAFVMMGQIALSRNEPEQALAFGSRALRLDNTIWQAHLLMSKALHSIADYPAAIRNARNAVWFGRNSAEACHWYGKILLESGDMEKGLEMLSDSYRLGEEHAGFLLRRNRITGNQKR